MRRVLTQNTESRKLKIDGLEDVAHTYGEHARFGRLDVSKAELKVLCRDLLTSGVVLVSFALVRN